MQSEPSPKLILESPEFGTVPFKSDLLLSLMGSDSAPNLVLTAHTSWELPDRPSDSLVVSRTELLSMTLADADDEGKTADGKMTWSRAFTISLLPQRT